MSRKVYVNLRVRLLLQLEEGVQAREFLDECDYSFTSSSGEGEIEDSMIMEYDIEDSK